MKAIRLYFESPVRSGTAGLGLESTDQIIHSDTLFGAIVNSLSSLNDDVEEFVKSFESREVSISSCFPFNGDTYYFPVPHLPRIRKRTFLTKNEFEVILSGSTEISDEEDLSFMKEVEIPKVAIDRKTSNSSIYYLSSVRFDGESGLFFLVEGKDRIIKMIKTALKYLQDEGIGGKRTWGLGKFKYKNKIEDFKLGINGEGEFYTTLSLTFPTDLSSIRYWKPVVRSGWINTANGTLRKPKVIMASEGSIFEREDPGQLVDLDIAYSDTSRKIGHKVYLNGLSFLIKMVV